MHIAYFVTSHGYGHAARACAVMQKIIALIPRVQFEIFTQVPEWFFRQSLPANHFRWHSCFTDIGFIQNSPFVENIETTIQALENHTPFSEMLITEIADDLKKRACSLVICDISPVGILAARQAGLPVVLIENFTWDWIYAYYPEPVLNNYSEYFHSIYQQVDLRIQTRPNVQDNSDSPKVLPIARTPQKDRTLTRKLLGIPEEASILLISTGGVKTQHNILPLLKKYPDYFFIVPHDVQSYQRSGNIITLPHRSQFYHPDLVAAADAVVCKAGYSTIAEAYLLQKPLVLIKRPAFPESPYLVKFAIRNLPHLVIDMHTFECGTWLTHLPGLIPAISPAGCHVNGALEAAQIIKEAYL